MDVSRRRVRRRAISAVLSAVVFAAAGTAQGQDFFENLVQAFGFGGGAEAGVEAAAVVIDAADGFAGNEDPFVPQIKTLLGAELHFIRKVCEPDDAQMDEIRKAGLAETEVIAKRCAAMQQRNRHEGYPDARGLLADAVQNAVAEVMPPEKARRYADELAARKEARKAAAAEMIATLVDRRVTLTPKQYEEVTTATLGNWQDEWARDFQMFLYEEYAPTPDGQVINGVLTERQRKLWGGGNSSGRIFFGWEHELGLDWGGQVEIGRDLLVEKAAPAQDGSALPAEPPAGDGINRTHFDPNRRSGPAAEETP